MLTVLTYQVMLMLSV